MMTLTTPEQLAWLDATWPAPPHVRALTTLRTGGYSQGRYKSLNLAAHVADDPSAVTANRLALQQTLQLPASPVWLQQVHGTTVVRADAVSGVPQADASFARCADVVCAVLTADCLPLLLTTRTGDMVAAVHGGWRGLLDGIIERTVSAMQAPPHELLAWLGPAIGPEQFEVGDEVYAAFIARERSLRSVFRAHTAGKWLADIYEIARCLLQRLGVTAVYGGGHCTVSAAERFYSYRRDGQQTGRMASLIWIAAS